MPSTPAIPPLLTVDNLAERWGVTVERATKRLRERRMKCLNMGTVKNPELRFRIDWIETWEGENYYLTDYVLADQNQTATTSTEETKSITVRPLPQLSDFAAKLLSELN